MKKWTPPQVLAVLTYFNDVFFPIRANDQICEEHQIKQKEKKNIRIISGIADVVYKQGQMDRSDSIAAHCP